MRSLLSLSLWAVVGLVGLANAATLTTTCVAEICLDPAFNGLSGRGVATPSEFNSRALTNAERLARGLPPNAPSRRGKYFVPVSSIRESHAVHSSCCSHPTIVDATGHIFGSASSQEWRRRIPWLRCPRPQLLDTSAYSGHQFRPQDQFPAGAGSDIWERYCFHSTQCMSITLHLFNHSPIADVFPIRITVVHFLDRW